MLCRWIVLIFITLKSTNMFTDYHRQKLDINQAVGSLFGNELIEEFKELPKLPTITESGAPFSNKSDYAELFARLVESGLEQDIVNKLRQCYRYLSLENLIVTANSLLEYHMLNYGDQPLCFLRSKNYVDYGGYIPSTSQDCMEQIVFYLARQHGCGANFYYVYSDEPFNPQRVPVVYYCDDAAYTGQQLISTIRKSHAIPIRKIQFFLGCCSLNSFLSIKRFGIDKNNLHVSYGMVHFYEILSYDEIRRLYEFSTSPDNPLINLDDVKNLQKRIRYIAKMLNEYFNREVQLNPLFTFSLFFLTLTVFKIPDAISFPDFSPFVNIISPRLRELGDSYYIPVNSLSLLPNLDMIELNIMPISEI